ncbi:hypothetical protein HYALB_00011400 [Hymenoscyphus albidus]|uniref:Uncharacterized protein n=1 Tax=Hymenoscyphus albidus TaxID=595503 RepID=A0A9N9LG52_9HELO|nr:hypothetical protein HYALB_00011400 [Hymenoscyphus albidus]
MQKPVTLTTRGPGSRQPEFMGERARGKAGDGRESTLGAAGGKRGTTVDRRLKQRRKTELKSCKSPSRQARRGGLNWERRRNMGTPEAV